MSLMSLVVLLESVPDPHQMSEHQQSHLLVEHGVTLG